MKDSGEITQLLMAWKEGDQAALDDLMPMVEAELRQIAHRFMRREEGNHTLQTTALVNEAYLKLINQRSMSWQNRSHFFAISAQIMRRILINYARDRRAEKRGGDVLRVNLDDAFTMSDEKSDELIALDDALERLEKFDELKSRIVEMRYFGGLTIEETAEVLGIAPPTVSLHWRLAKAWLAAEIKK